jgi:hypothetical protein
VPSPYPPPPPQPVQYAQPLPQYQVAQPQYQQPAVQPAPVPQYYAPPAQPQMAQPVQQVQPPLPRAHRWRGVRSRGRLVQQPLGRFSSSLWPLRLLRPLQRTSPPDQASNQ